ncbi:MAG: tetratricopeptide repeat protein, partial [Saprospiraceae bacterium]|nr:tetratricopeptide repeat protein [Saprospiraceae bacterium]
LYTVTGNYIEAIDKGYKSVASFEALLSHEPNNYLNMTHNLLAKNALREPLTEVLRPGEALALLKDVELHLLESQRMDPPNKHIKTNLAINYNAMGRVLSENGDYANAIKAFQNAYALSQEMIKADVDNAEIVRSTGFTLEFMGDAYLANEKYAEAKIKYTEAISLYQKTDPGLINVAQIKINICRLYLKEKQNELLNQHQKELLALENNSLQDTLNIRNIVFLSEFYANTALALNLNRGSDTSLLKDPCYYYRRSLDFSDRLKLKKSLSPLRMKNRTKLINALPSCAH